ncbi:PASTA domain-containing protein [Prosthecobacter sp.]|uniref:PASTA domain-containing protein n=1 Tax=Prosthecobacter sp. TaxID=1965333 RepID=UPI003783371B
MKRKRHPLLTGVLVLVTATVMADDFQLALNQAKDRILKYQIAKTSGDPAALREATMRLQEDPLAIRRVNASATEGFKKGLNADIGAVQQQTRELIKTRLAERGVSPERVSFFEATNPTKPGEKIKVGQDWDMTVRIDGRDVPTRISQPIAHEAYYEVATGNKPPPGGDAAARAEYRNAANHYAEQQSLAVTDYQYREAYGGGPKEGGAIIAGPKDARLRDPVQMSEVIEYKSNEARNLATDLRKEGKIGDAVGRDIEEIRQSTKQFEKQVQPRVEAQGGKVPEFIQRGQEMMKQMDSGKLTPEQVREQLQAMGETPETFIRKTAQLVESAQVLRDPGSRGAPAPDVFTENVLNRLQSRQMMKILEQVDNGALTLEQAREQIQKLAPPPTAEAPAESALSIGKRQAGNALTGLWIASTAFDSAAEEGKRAAMAGQDPSRLRAAGNAILEASMIPGMIRGIERGKQIGEEELAKADKEGRSETSATLSGFGRYGKELSGWTLGSQIAEEEMADEEARAAQEGRDPNYLASWANATLRGLGEVLMINSIARSANSVTEEEVMQVGQDEVFRAWAQGKLMEDNKVFQGISRDLDEFMLRGDVKDPEFRKKFAEMADRYNNARLAMAKLTDATVKQFGDKDPLARAMQNKIVHMVDPPKVEAVIKEREASMITVPSVVGQDPISAGRALAKAGLNPQAAIVNKKPENVKVMVVFGQEPEAGKQVDPNETITFVYSNGKATEKSLKVPDVTKMARADAEKKLAELKFTFKATAGKEKPPRTAKKQEVYEQSPKKDTEVAEGSEVSFTYYAGIMVGDYKELKKDEAEAAITSDGFKPKVHEGELMAKTEPERLKVYEQKTKPGQYLWYDDEVECLYYKTAPGFQDGDGARVDERFAEAKVSSGDKSLPPNQKKPSAGERSEISFSTVAGSGFGTKSVGWYIRKYTDEADAKAMVAQQQRDGFFTVQDISMAGNSISSQGRQVAADKAIGTLHTSTPKGTMSSHVSMIIHRKVFLIVFTRTEPAAGVDFSGESARILKESKALVNDRFPNDD